MRVWLAALPAAGPVGLVVYILAGISLPLAAFFIAVIGATGWALIASRSKPAAHELARRAADGAIAGAIATVAYDAARYGLVSLVQMSFSPFHVWQLFGQLFLGEDANPTAAYVVGVAYHLGNGIGLGAAYRLVVSRPTVVNGIVWAMALEFTMALLYPSWLRMTALGEFLEVSVLGHAVYGIVLARLCQRAIARRQRVAATAAAPGGPDLGSSPGAPS
jgi:hypothetical protein